MACGHEAFPVGPPEAWSRGGEEHERGEPRSKASGTNIRDGEDYFGVQQAKECPSIAGTLLHHALDQPDLQFAVGRFMSAVTKPQRKHLVMTKHCLRHMLCMEVRLPRVARRAGVLIDAYFSSDSERRRSVDCVHIYHGGHLIEASTSTQQVVSLSTAEIEFYGIVRGAASGIQLREVSCSSASWFGSACYLILQRPGL